MNRRQQAETGTVVAIDESTRRLSPESYDISRMVKDRIRPSFFRPRTLPGRACAAGGDDRHSLTGCFQREMPAGSPHRRTAGQRGGTGKADGSRRRNGQSPYNRGGIPPKKVGLPEDSPTVGKRLPVNKHLFILPCSCIGSARRPCSSSPTRCHTTKRASRSCRSAKYRPSRRKRKSWPRR